LELESSFSGRFAAASSFCFSGRVQMASSRAAIFDMDTKTLPVGFSGYHCEGLHGFEDSGDSRVSALKTLWILFLSIWLIALTCLDGYPFDYTDVEKRARNLAQSPYLAPEDPLPSDFPKIDYEVYRRIQFDHKKAIWADTSLPFRLETFQ